MTKKLLLTFCVLAHLALTVTLAAKITGGAGGFGVVCTQEETAPAETDSAETDSAKTDSVKMDSVKMAPAQESGSRPETRQNTTRQNSTRQNPTRQNSTRQDSYRQDSYRQDSYRQDSYRRDTFKIYYRWDKSGLDTTYMNNGLVLRQMDSLLKGSALDSVSLVSSSSPEGNMRYNMELARKRGETMRGHLAKKLLEDLLDSMSVIPLGSNYDEFLRMIKDADGLPDREKVVSEFEKGKRRGENPDLTFRRMTKMGEGRPYAYIRRNILRHLRYAEVVTVSHPVGCTEIVDVSRPILPPADSTVAEPIVPELSDDIEIDDETLPEDTLKIAGDSLRAETIVARPELSDDIEIDDETLPEDTLKIAGDSLRVEQLKQPADTTARADTTGERKYWYPALKTNILYDAVTALNAEIEFPIGKHFSIAVEDLFPWWNWGPNGKKYCFQLWEMGLEPRWWFIRNDKKDYLSGHYAGVYGMSGKYDFQWDTALCYQGEFWSVGLTYGYALPVCKWMNMEFSISAGFLRSDYRHYQPDPAYEHLYRDPYKAGKFSWFGPTKAKISLVIPIGKDSHNAKGKADSGEKNKKQKRSKNK